jgi:hypothetical protein
MDSQQAYGARLEAQMRAADARLDQMEAQARARNARAEMDEISGLRARRDKIREQVASARKELRDDWGAVRGKVDTKWTEFRRAVSASHRRFVSWDGAREKKLTAHLDEAEAVLREEGAKDAEVAADVRVELIAASEELREKAGAARKSFDAWRAKRADKTLQERLDDAELELDEASNRLAAALKGEKQPAPTGGKQS